MEHWDKQSLTISPYLRSYATKQHRVLFTRASSVMSQQAQKKLVRGARSPESEVSPGTVPHQPPTRKRDYFSVKRWSTGGSLSPSTRVSSGQNGRVAPSPLASPATTPAAAPQATASVGRTDVIPERREGSTSTTNSALSPVPAASPDAGASTPSEEGGGDAQLSPLIMDDDGAGDLASRKSPAASVTFRPPLNPRLPQGHQRGRLRASTPSPER